VTVFFGREFWEGVTERAERILKMPVRKVMGERMKCPGCDLELSEDDVLGQIRHMEAEHPEIIEERRAEAALWDGWEDE
jgi:hypothetical protein